MKKPAQIKVLKIMYRFCMMFLHELIGRVLFLTYLFWVWWVGVEGGRLPQTLLCIPYLK